MEIYFQVVWKRIRQVILTAVVTIIVVLAITFVIPPYYTVSTTLLIQPFGLGTIDYATYLYSQQLAATFTEILKSKSVLYEVAERVNLDIEDVPPYTAELVPDSELLQISVTSSDSKLATEVAETLALILLERVTLQYSVNLDNIEESLENRVLELEAEINELITERAELAEQVPRDNIRIAEIDRTLTSREAVYNTMLSNLNEMLIDQSAQSNLVSIFEPAIEPEKPTGPSMLLNLVAGITTGIVGGISVAFLLEGLHPKLYSTSQIEAVMHSPVLDTIPKINKRSRNNIDLFGKDKTRVESFRGLRTTIEALLSGHCSRNSIAFLSYEPNVDNASILTFLGVVLARNFKRTIIVDTDNYRPTIHFKLDLDNSPGLSDILSNEINLEQAIQVTSIDNLDCISAGTHTDRAAELYNSSTMTALVAKLEETYDYVLFHTPPTLVVTDGIVIARHVCANIIVMKSDADKRIATKAYEELNKVGIDVLGIVLVGTGSNVNTKWTTKYVK